MLYAHISHHADTWLLRVCVLYIGPLPVLDPFVFCLCMLFRQVDCTHQRSRLLTANRNVCYVNCMYTIRSRIRSDSEVDQITKMASYEE